MRKAIGFLLALTLAAGLALLAPSARATDGEWDGCFICRPHDFGTDPDQKCWQVGHDGSGAGTHCEQRYFGGFGGHLCIVSGFQCSNSNVGGGPEGCWAESCWGGADDPGGGWGGGGGGGSCHVQYGSYCPAECMSCTYYYY